MVGAKPIRVKQSVMRRDAENAVARALDASAKLTKKKLQLKVSGWKKKPGFDITGDSTTRIVGTENDVFLWQDEGTDPYVIPPFAAKNKRALAFSYKGANVVVRRLKRAIHHPGIRGAKWSATVARQLEQSDMPRIFTREFARI